MGRLSRRCRFLADGRKIEETWRELLNSDFVIDACRQALHQSDIEELVGAYQLLCAEAAKKNAQAVHTSLFKFATGDLRAGFVAQCIAAACLAFHCRQPLTQAAARAIPIWARRALGEDATSVVACEVSEVETTQRLIRRSLESCKKENQSTAAICDLAFELAGVQIHPMHTLRVPILLVDRVNGGGILAWLQLQKFASNRRICYPAARTLIGTELATDTLEGIQRVWQYVCKDANPDVDVCWRIEGTDTISGRSAEAAIAVGLKLLLRDAPYDERCVISAQMEDDGSLGPVSGIQEMGHPKLVAAQALKNATDRVQVLVSDANRLNATDYASWQNRGIDVNSCRHVDELFTIASQQLQQLHEFLSRHVSMILEQASVRMERSISSVSELAALVIPLHIARGIREVDTDDGDELFNAGDTDQDDTSPTSNRKVHSWSEFTQDFKGRAVVLGDPGFGKTALMWLETATRCVDAATTVQSGATTLSNLRFALFVSAAKLAEFVESSAAPSDNQPIITLIRTVYGLPAQLEDFFAAKISSGQCLLCLDALDEVPDPRDLSAYLAGLAAQQPAASIILTSRLTGFREPPFPTTDENQIELLPFSRTQMKAAVNAWFADDLSLAKIVWRQISRNERLHDVFRSPILLHMASQQIRSARENNQVLPNWERRSQLYQGFLNAAMEHLQHRTSEPIREMERHEFRMFLGELAYRLWKDNPRRTVWKREQLYGLIRSVVSSCNFMGLQRRFHQLFDDLQDSGLLVPVSAGNPNSPLMFLHRTIGEYLVGQQVASRLNRSGDWKIIEHKCWDPAWEQAVLFCAGSLDRPEILLSRLVNPEPTAENAYGDDLHRHRLMLAAQCLPEVKTNSSVQELTLQITDGVHGFIQRYSDDSVLPTASVNALRALMINDASGSEGNFRKLFLQSVPMPERFITQIGSVAYSEPVFDWLVERLWQVCASTSVSTGQTQRPPQGVAQALVAICDELDMDRVLKTKDTSDDAILWRVVGTLFRAGISETTTRIFLSPQFLNRLGDAWLNPAKDASLGLRQAIANLPQIDADTLSQSSLIPLCLEKLNAKASDAEAKAALTLLRGLGETAGKDQRVSSALSTLNFPAHHGRLVIDTVLAMRNALPRREFLGALEHTILTQPEREAIGIDIYVALNALEDEELKAGLERLIELKPSVIPRFCSIMERGPNNSHVVFACRLLRSAAHRKAGLQIVKRLIELLTLENSRDQILSTVTVLLQALVGNNTNLAPEDPSLWDRLRQHNELSIRMMFQPLFRLACLTQSTDDLVDYIVSCLQATSSVFNEQLFEMSRSIRLLLQSQRDYLRNKVKEYGLTDAASRYPHLIYAMDGVSDLLLDSIAQTVSSTTGTQVLRTESLGLLREFPRGSLDDRFVKPSLELIGNSRANLRSAGAAALRNLKSEAITVEVAEALVRSMERENTPGDLTKTVSILAIAHPALFLNLVLDIYLDEENSARDHAISVLPQLGSCLFKSSRFSDIHKRLDSPIRSSRIEALRILTLMLKTCDNEQRDELISLLATPNDCSWLMRYVSADDGDRRYSDWLLKQLSHEDPRIVNFACALLLQNSQGQPERRSQTVLSRILAEMSDRRQLCIRLSETSGSHRSFDRIANSAAQFDYRFFPQSDGSFTGITCAELAGFPETNEE